LLSTASEVVSSVGNQFAQPVRPRGRDGQPKRAALAAVSRRRQVDVMEAFERWLGRYGELPVPETCGLALRADFREVLAEPPCELAAIYADPPYTRDHYSRFYHVLETIAVGDEPEVSLMRLNGATRVSRGLYRAQRHRSPFCIKTQAPGAFADLFAGARALDGPLVLSYSPYAEGSADRPVLRKTPIGRSGPAG
jgi:hypothetical protein